MTKTIVAGYGAGTDVMIVQDISRLVLDRDLFEQVGRLGAAQRAQHQRGQLLLRAGRHDRLGADHPTPQEQSAATTTTLSNSITSLQPCGSSGMPVCSGSDMAAGIIQATTEFAAAAYPNKSNTQVPKAMILVSDGAPEQQLQRLASDL